MYAFKEHIIGIYGGKCTGALVVQSLNWSIFQVYSRQSKLDCDCDY